MKLLLKLNMQRCQNLQAVKNLRQSRRLENVNAQSGLTYVPPKGGGALK